MEKKDILLQVIEHYAQGNKTRFAKMLGVTPQALGNMLARNSLDVEKILTNCVNVNPAFLLTGEGSIVLDEHPVAPKLEGIDMRINELLAISSNLTKQYAELNALMTQAMTIIERSQQQFDRVLNLYDRIARTSNPSTNAYMVAEEGANTE